MKRVVTISWFLVVFCIRTYGQLGRISGELRYEHRYQDFIYNDNLTKIEVSNPVLDLRMTGNVLSPRLLTYSLFSSFNANFITTGNAYFSYSASQYTWNRYNLNLNALPYSPVKLTLAARENAYDITSESDFTSDHTADRQQEQRAELSVHQISWLPTLNLSYVRNRSYAVLGYPYDVVNQTFTFSASGATDTTGSYSLTGTMVDFRDRLSDAFDRFFTLQFSASRELSEKHGVNINSEFEQYAGYSGLGSSVAYRGIVTNRVRLMSVLSGNVAQTSYAQSRSVSLSQSASYRINEHFQCGLGASGFLGNGQVNTAGGERNDRYKSVGGFGNVQHQRSIAGMSVVNALLVGYNQQQYVDRYNNFQAGLANTIARQIGPFSATGNYNFSFLRVRNARSYDVVDNTAGIIMGGTLPHGIRSQSDLRYRDVRYPGDESPYRTQRSLFLTQRFNGSFVYLIPFHLGLSVSANWYFSLITGRTYGWSATFASPSFFLRGLAVDYAYSRSYDPYYQREVAEHRGSMSYQWRALVFSSNFRYATFPVRVREINFRVSRFF